MKKPLSTSPYDLIYDTIDNIVVDENGKTYRVDDIRSSKIGGYYDYWIGLQLLEDEDAPLLYVTLDRYDQMISYSPFD